MSEMRLGSLFSGYGGLDQAVERVTGAMTAWVSDIDKGACKILAHRYPDVPNHGDLTRIDWTSVEPVEILTGGFPCQDLSTAGKRAGLADGTRSGLWSHMAEAIDTLRPRLVVAENVRGLLSAEALRPVEPCTWCVGDDPAVDLRALGAVLADLADLGYDARWCGLRAADVGAPHGRFRVFLAAYPQGDGRYEGRPESARLIGGSDAADRGGTAADTDRGRCGESDQRLGVVPEPHADHRQPLTLLPTPAVNDMGKAYTPEEWDAWTERMKRDHGNGNGHGKSLEIEALRLLPTTTTADARASGGKPESSNVTLTDALVRGRGLLPTPSAADALGGHERRGGERGAELLLNGMAKAGHLERFGPYATAIARWEPIIGRAAPSPTEPTGKGGAHRLSPRFTEWMMGLPCGWTTDVPGITRNEALKACGNGVVPQQAAAALTWLLGLESERVA